MNVEKKGREGAKEEKKGHGSEAHCFAPRGGREEAESVGRVKKEYKYNW